MMYYNVIPTWTRTSCLFLQDWVGTNKCDRGRPHCSEAALGATIGTTGPSDHHQQARRVKRLSKRHKD
ncbi:hypothetical protein ILYODFUR_038282 [Ilyodon furcidens]|uniref:Uncharacterized protein n=1 Tax=Ilyodon furcidens TaxID=33524 RepID=A0ABV0T6E1_9TELE